jgi:branched-chain amino acid transport system permease protein
LNAFGILVFPKISIVLVFLVMAVVLIVRPWGLFGKREGLARRTAGLTVHPWRPFTPAERIAAAVVLALAAALPLIGGNYALTVASEIAIFVIFAVSLHFLMSVGGLASFGHAAYFGLGAYGVAFLAKLAGLPMIVCLLVGPLLGLLGAAVFGFFAVRLSGVYFAMLTLAFAQIVWSIAFQWVALTGGDNGILGVWPESWAASPARFFWLSLGVAALAVAALRIAVFSPFGFALRATRDSPLRGEAIGINGKRIQWTAFVIAGTIAGVAGALFAYLKGSVFPDSLGISLSVDALVMVLLGGVETVSGAVVGAIVYKALSIWLVSQTDLSKLILGGFIILIVVIFPKGIVGVMETIRHRRQASTKPALLSSGIETAE